MFLVERVEFDSSFDSATPGRYEKAYITPVSRGMLRVEAISAMLRGCRARRLTVAFNHSENTIALVVGLCSGHSLY